MKCVYMGKHKRSAVRGLEHLLTNGWDVLAVVAPPPEESVAAEQRLDLAARDAGLRLATDDELYASIEGPQQTRLAEVDVVFSFLFWKRIRQPLIELGRLGCLNFHPAPLPEMRGIGGYNVAILEDWCKWGVSAHFVDEELDTGDVVRVDRFGIDSDRETAFSLDTRSQAKLFRLFCWTADQLQLGEALPRTPQGPGRYVTREEFEELRAVRAEDPPELTARRIRAFWYPPYDGATIELNGRPFTLVDRDLLAEVAAAYRGAGVQP